MRGVGSLPRAAVEPQRADVAAAVREYYSLRDRLTDGLDINEFWRRYPELGDDHDLKRGIDLEIMLGKWSHDPPLVRLNYRTDLESYQPIRVFVRANEALAYVHGVEARGKVRRPTMGERAPTDPPTR